MRNENWLRFFSLIFYFLNLLHEGNYKCFRYSLLLFLILVCSSLLNLLNFLHLVKYLILFFKIEFEILRLLTSLSMKWGEA